MSFRTRAALAALSLMTAGCGVVGAGVRAEGKPSPLAVPEATQAAVGGQALSIDPVQVLRGDPEVSGRVKQVLRRPCRGGYADGWFPVYLRYAEVAGPGQVAMIVVQSCEDDVACSGSLGTYVYRLSKGEARRVYTSAESGTRVVPGDGGLRVSRPAWDGGERGGCPTGSESAALAWNGSTLVREGKWAR
jgi:hypothetical protein